MITLEDKGNKMSKLVFTSINDIFFKMCLGKTGLTPTNYLNNYNGAWYVTVY